MCAPHTHAGRPICSRPPRSLCICIYIHICICQSPILSYKSLSSGWGSTHCSRHRMLHPSPIPCGEPLAPHRIYRHRRQLAGRHGSYLGRINENELIFHCLYCLFPIAYILPILLVAYSPAETQISFAKLPFQAYFLSSPSSSSPAPPPMGPPAPTGPWLPAEGAVATSMATATWAECHN